MSEGSEVELKLQVGLMDIAKLLVDPIFADRDPVMHDMLATYFDTDGRALHAAGVSLRIRTSAGKRVQTIKAESEAASSLFARGEWERAVQTDAPELDGAPPIVARALAGKKALSLAPAFIVAVNRTSVVHEIGGARIELVADQGRISGAGQDALIAEIELELLDGPQARLFDLMHRIAERVPVRLGVEGKAERGYALLEGKQALSVKAEPITLSRNIDTATLFEAVAGACVRQFRRNEDRLLASGSPASLHQARVGLRRLRSALSTFKPMLEGDELDRYQSEFRTLASALGGVRDIDVMVDRIEHEPTLEQLRAARHRRLAAAVEILEAEATRILVLDFVEWISVGEWRDREDTSEMREAPALVTAAQTLDDLRRKIKRRGGHLANLDDPDRHRVRIVGKKLRYSAEFFSDLYRSKRAVARRQDFLNAIEKLQSALGHLNDLAGGRALLDDLGIGDGDAILSGGKKSNTKRYLADAEKAHLDLIAVKKFWR